MTDGFERMERFAGTVRKATGRLWLAACMILPGVCLALTALVAELCGAFDEDHD